MTAKTARTLAIIVLVFGVIFGVLTLVVDIKSHVPTATVLGGTGAVWRAACLTALVLALLIERWPGQT